jgi:hypothetical protein
VKSWKSTAPPTALHWNPLVDFLVWLLEMKGFVLGDVASPDDRLQRLPLTAWAASSLPVQVALLTRASELSSAPRHNRAGAAEGEGHGQAQVDAAFGVARAYLSESATSAGLASEFGDAQAEYLRGPEELRDARVHAVLDAIATELDTVSRDVDWPIHVYATWATGGSPSILAIRPRSLILGCGALGEPWRAEFQESLRRLDEAEREGNGL